MGCGQSHRKAFSIANREYMVDSHVDALNIMKYATSQNTYAHTVWGVRLGNGYSGVKRYGYYGIKQHGLYEHNMKYGKGDAYERRSLYEHIAANTDIEYKASNTDIEYKASNIDDEISVKEEEVKARDDVSGVIYLASRRSETSDRANELQFQIDQEKMSGIEGAKIIEFSTFRESQRARQLHGGIRDERRRAEGDLREAA